VRNYFFFIKSLLLLTTNFIVSVLRLSILILPHLKYFLISRKIPIECSFSVILNYKNGLYPVLPLPFLSWIVIWNEPSSSLIPVIYHGLKTLTSELFLLPKRKSQPFSLSILQLISVKLWKEFLLI